MNSTNIAVLTVGIIAISSIIVPAIRDITINTEVINSAYICIGSLTTGVVVGRASKKPEKKEEVKK